METQNTSIPSPQAQIAANAPTSMISGGTNLLHAPAILEHFGVGHGMQVVDFGCGGAGHFVFPAARLVGAEGLVYAVDVLKSVLSGVESKAQLEGFTNVKTLWANLEVSGSVKAPEGAIDAVFIINLLFQNTKFDAILNEGKRLLKPGGKLLVVEWKPSGGTVFAPPLDKRVPQHVIKNAARSVGLDFQEEFSAGAYHYGLIFLKPGQSTE